VVVGVAMEAIRRVLMAMVVTVSNIREVLIVVMMDSTAKVKYRTPMVQSPPMSGVNHPIINVVGSSRRSSADVGRLSRLFVGSTTVHTITITSRHGSSGLCKNPPPNFCGAQMVSLSTRSLKNSVKATAVKVWRLNTKA